MRSRSRKTENLRAFTILELLVVIVILAIAAAVVIPTMSSTQDVKATSAARIIAADIEYAQSMAITHQEQVTVTFSPVGESYSLSNASGPLVHPMTKDAYTVDFGTKNGFENLDVVSASFGGTAAVTFDELGAPDNAGNATIQVGAHAYQIAVAAATGRVSVTYVGP
jgi:general secretion pathway protein H